MAYSQTAGARVSSDNFQTWSDHWALGTSMNVQLTDLAPMTSYRAKALLQVGQNLYLEQGQGYPFRTPGDNPMYFENRGSSTVTLTIQNSMSTPPDLEYSMDKRTWIQMGFEGTESIAIPAGGKAYLRGDNETLYDVSNFGGLTIRSTGDLYGGGDIMSLLDRSGWLSVVPENAFSELFSGMTTLVTPPDCSRITEIQYYGMAGTFMESGITLAPDFSSLSVVKMAGITYMCQSCARLTQSSDFRSVTEWWWGAASQAFEYCTSLTTVPDFADAQFLHTNMGDDTGIGVFENMFHNCTSLTTAPSLARISDTSVRGGHSTNLFKNMFKGCTSLTSAADLPYLSSDMSSCAVTGLFQSMYEGCTSLESADVSHVTSRGGTKNMFQRTFKGCTSLATVIVGGYVFEASNHQEWLDNVANEGTIYALKGIETIPSSSTSGCPNGWSVTYVS